MEVCFDTLYKLKGYDYIVKVVDGGYIGDPNNRVCELIVINRANNECLSILERYASLCLEEINIDDIPPIYCSTGGDIKAVNTPEGKLGAFEVLANRETTEVVESGTVFLSYSKWRLLETIEEIKQGKLNYLTKKLNRIKEDYNRVQAQIDELKK